MATLNLGSYDLKNGSVIGYSKDAYDVVASNDTEAIKGFSESADISTISGGWSVDLTKLENLEGFADNSGKNWSITVDASTTTEFELGDGKDSVTVTNLKGDDAYVSTGDGKDVVTVEAAESGLVNLGDGADKVVVEAGTFSIAGGAGKDSVDVSGMASGTVTLTDFDATEDVLVVGGVAPQASVLGSDGTIKVADGAVVQVNETNGYYLVNASTSTGKKSQLVAWAADNGSNIDLGSYTKSVTIIGTDNEAADTLIGGSKNDTIAAGAGDYVYGGAGSDSIVVDSSGENTFVGLSANGGKDVVLGFETVGSTDGDTVYLFENNIGDGVELSSKSSNLVVKQGKATLTLSGIASGSETVVNIQDNTQTNYKVDFVSGTASVTDEDSMYDVYYSDASKNNNALSFSSFGDELVVDLGNTGIFENTGSARYYGDFASVTGGQEETILMGAAANKETLIAGAGDTTLWGGGSAADVLNGGSGTSNVVTYFYTTGDGKDTVTGASWGTSDSDDVLYFKDVNLASIKNDGKTTTFNMADSSDKLTVSGLKANSAVKFTNDGETIKQAKIGVSGKANSWTYEDSVDMYLGGKKNSLTVSGDAEVWLAGNDGKTYEDVAKVDASTSTGTVVIAGTTNNELLIAGKGDSSLWGGLGGSNDTLKGSAVGSTDYYFGNGEGNDVITNTSSDDKVLLYNVSGENIKSLEKGSGELTITLTDGSSLTVKGMSSSSSVNQFQLADGSKWTYAYNTNTWTKNN